MRKFSRQRIELHYWNRKIPVDAIVSKIDLLLRIPVYLGPNFLKKYKDFTYRHRAISHPPSPFFNDDSNLPDIQITIDCAEKDMALISKVIHQAEQNVLNPVTEIMVIVPELLLVPISRIIDSERFKTTVRVISEDEILSKSLRERIRIQFPLRYGWVVHQFLTLQQIMNSNKAGILSIDSDTLLLRPMAFLNSEGVQVLMESLEYNKPYYEFLNRVSLDYPINTPTHVTHYSFFQKDILVSLFHKIGIAGVEEFFDFVERFADPSNNSPFCVDREFYALGLRLYFPNRFTLVKFANISMLRDLIEEDQVVHELSLKFNSVSCHSYLHEGVN